jgi:hypothetical protein
MSVTCGHDRRKVRAPEPPRSADLVRNLAPILNTQRDGAVGFRFTSYGCQLPSADSDPCRQLGDDDVVNVGVR